MIDYTPISNKDVKRETRRYRIRTFWFFVKGIAITCFIIGGFLLLTSNNVHAFFDWSSSTAQERYIEAEENFSRALLAAEMAQIQLLERKGDLAYEKLEKSVQEKNIAEIDRLRDVIDEVAQKIKTDFTLVKQ